MLSQASHKTIKIAGAPLYRRFSETTLREALEDTPIVLIHGSRQCGKSEVHKI